MLFVDDIALIDETRSGFNVKLERWRHALESRGFRLSRSKRTKTESLKCGFSGEEEGGEEVTSGGVAIPRVEKFMYLGSVIQKK